MTVNRQNIIDYFTAYDNLPIRYGCWSTTGGCAGGSIVLLNGRGEFLEKYAETIQELNQRLFDVYSLDWRGQGLSGRLLPDRLKGHVDSFDDYVVDLDRFLEMMVVPHAVRPIMIVAHSMGGHIALRYLSEEKHDINRAVLLSPMIDIHTPPLPGNAARFAANLAAACGLRKTYVPGTSRVHPAKIAFADNRLTSDRRRFYDHVNAVSENPDLAVGGVTWGWLHAAFRSIDKIGNPTFLKGTKTPVLMISAGSDRIVSNPAQQRAADLLPRGRLIRIQDARHEILKERDPLRDQFWQAFDSFTANTDRQ